MPERPTLVLEGEKPNGTARVLHTVLNEKLDEAPWKAKPVKALSNRTVRLLITDRDEWVDVVVGADGTVDVRSSAPDTKPQVTVALVPVSCGSQRPRGAAETSEEDMRAAVATLARFREALAVWQNEDCLGAWG